MPAEMYRYGTMHFTHILCFLALVPSVGYLYAPMFHRLRVASSFGVILTIKLLLDELIVRPLLTHIKESRKIFVIFFYLCVYTVKYLELRFNVAVRKLASIILILQMVCSIL